MVESVEKRVRQIKGNASHLFNLRRKLTVNQDLVSSEITGLTQTSQL